MQLELKDIQHEVGITFIYVTHDQEEALTMSDRIGVMNEGKLVQIGGSEEIYASPSNLFVARFVGEMSFLTGEITEPGAVRLSGGEIVQAKTNSSQGTSVTLTLRPEMIQLYADRSEAPAGRNAVDGSVARRIFQGDSMFYEVDIGVSGSFEVHVENLPGARRWEVGDDVVVDFHPEAALALSE
jgi:putative spermidine/putrescine transport system ATP-binding protein/spermidine/putrescine transport system ATP-binding protein